MNKTAAKYLEDICKKFDVILSDTERNAIDQESLQCYGVNLHFGEGESMKPRCYEDLKKGRRDIYGFYTNQLTRSTVPVEGSTRIGLALRPDSVEDIVYVVISDDQLLKQFHEEITRLDNTTPKPEFRNSVYSKIHLANASIIDLERMILMMVKLKEV